MFRISRKKTISLLLTLCFMLTMVIPGFAAGGTDTANSLSDAKDGIVGYYSKNKTNLETWREVVGLTNAGQDLSKGAWMLPDWGIDELNEDSQPTDYVGAIFGMLAMDQNPKDIKGRNLANELAALQNTDGSFGEWFNQSIWSIAALDEVGGSYDVEQAVAFILSQQKGDGGFALFGDVADPDTTGEVIYILAEHKGVAGVSTAIESALDCLKAIQLPTGGFSSWGEEAPESAAAVIRGLLAWGGQDILGDQWQKEEGNMIDFLFSFQLKDGSFIHSKSETKANAIATEQALLAVADLLSAGIDYTVTTGQRHLPPEPVQATVRVRAEGTSGSLVDKKVTVEDGTALDALVAAVGEENADCPGGFVNSIFGESGKSISDEIGTSWMYYVIRDGVIAQDAFSLGAGDYDLQDGDQVIFYIGAMDSITWEAKTFFPVVNIDHQSPTQSEEFTLTIKTMVNDWMAGQLVELDEGQLAAIGEYTVLFQGKNYVTENGELTIKPEEAGISSLLITNQNEEGYPNVVTYKGELNVQTAEGSDPVVDVDEVDEQDQQEQDKAADGSPKTGDDGFLLSTIAGVIFFSLALLVLWRKYQQITLERN